MTTLDERQRAAVRAIVLDRGHKDRVVWIDKLRRFATLYGRNLRHTARLRFGTDASTHLIWMADLLLDAAEHIPEPGSAPIDQACVNAVLYCHDAVDVPAKQVERCDKVLATLHDWLLEHAPQPPLEPAFGTAFRYRQRIWAKEASAREGVVILSPSPFSLYSLAVFELCNRVGIPVQAVVLRKFTLGRIRSEWRRDGSRLLKKIFRKLILRADENADQTDVSIRSVIDALNPETADIRKLAKKLGVPVLEVDAFDDAIVPLQALAPSLALFTGGGIVPEQVCQVFSRGIINVHMGILPRYRGMDVVQAPLLEGCFDSVGLSAHFMVRGLDAGPVILKFQADPRNYASLGALRNALSSVMPLIMIDAALGLISGRLLPQTQPLTGRSYYIMHRRLLSIVDPMLEAHARTTRDEGDETILAEVHRFLSDDTIFPAR